ncbi:MAG TPA: hypothetical protein PLM63_03245 [bacterium]|nr:hypothetical protein [bacterium]
MPNPLQCDVYKNGLIWHNGSKIYHAFQRVPNGEWIIENPFSPKYSILNGIMSYQNKIIVGSTNGTLFDVSVYSTRTVTSNWTSVTTLLSDNNAVGMINAIEVTTNTLSTGARCDLSVYINQNVTAAKTLTINTVGASKHLFRNLDISNINEFKIKLDWSNGSTTNLCDIRRITIYGSTVSR